MLATIQPSCALCCGSPLLYWRRVRTQQEQTSSSLLLRSEPWGWDAPLLRGAGRSGPNSAVGVFWGSWVNLDFVLPLCVAACHSCAWSCRAPPWDWWADLPQCRNGSCSCRKQETCWCSHVLLLCVMYPFLLRCPLDWDFSIDVYSLIYPFQTWPQIKVVLIELIQFDLTGTKWLELDGNCLFQ